MFDVLQFLFKLPLNPSPRRGWTNGPIAFYTNHFKHDLEAVTTLTLSVNTTTVLEVFPSKFSSTAWTCLI